jgi:hypothetical protein
MDSIIKAEQELFAYESEIYNRMRKIAGKLNTRIIEPIVRFRLIDGKSGREKLFRERHSHSFVRNEYVSVTAAVPYQEKGTLYADGHLRSWQTSDTIGGVNDTVIQDITPETLNNGFYAGTSVDDHGIVVGRDATAEDFDDFELGNLVTDGTGPNQMEYLQMTKSESWVGGSSYYEATWTRAFDNVPVTPTSITIYEVGIVYDNATDNFLIARDIDVGGIVVPDGDRLYVEYEIRTSFP